MRAYSDDLRERVIQDVVAGEKLRETAAKWKVGMRTVATWMKRYRETGSCCSIKKGRRGVKRKLLECLDLLRILVEERPDITLSEIQSKLPVRVCLQTIATELKKMKFTFKKKYSGGRAATP